MPQKEAPWLFRTYAGHSTARASNQLYRTNLSKGQTGLSVAFDLPTQTGYDSDHELARGEVGKVGVPVSHLGDMRMLYEQGVATADLRGTTQNDILKEYLSRGTFIFPPQPSKRIIVDMIAWCAKNAPKWNPINICSYHLQEVGATPVQEISFALANAIDILDAVKSSGQISNQEFPQVFASFSFFVNAGIRFIEETCKMRAFVKLWDRIGRERYSITDERALRFRYGVQVNSLGLTEAQPENNVQRIVLEMLAVTLSKDARARSVQLPAWNEALGLPRPWDQQWSLRMQQVLAFETDLLEYEDIFNGSHVIEAKTNELVEQAWAEMNEILNLGGAFEAVETLKGRLVQSMSSRTSRIEKGDQRVIGVNAFTQTAHSPLGGTDNILKVDPKIEKQMIKELEKWRKSRDKQAVDRALISLKTAAENNTNLMPPSIELAIAGGTTGEWSQALRDVFGEFRAPTGVGGSSGRHGQLLDQVVEFVKKIAGGPPRLLVAKPGLDGHSSGAEQIAVAARDSGMEVVYSGIRLTPEQIAASARDEDPDVIGLSILSGSHLDLVPEVMSELKKLKVSSPVVVGGIIPEDDRARLKKLGVAAIYTPKDFDIARIMRDIAELAVSRREN